MRWRHVMAEGKTASTGCSALTIDSLTHMWVNEGKKRQSGSSRDTGRSKVGTSPKTRHKTLDARLGEMPPSPTSQPRITPLRFRPTVSCLTNADSGFFNDDQGGLRDIHILLQQPVAHSHDVVGFQIPGSQKHDTPIGLVFMNG